MTDALASARALTAELRAHLATIVLGTATADGTPDASVAAALLDSDGAFVIYVSGLAAHTRHLRVNPRASVLLTAAETSAGNAFARPRLTFACAAETVGRRKKRRICRCVSREIRRNDRRVGDVARLPVLPPATTKRTRRRGLWRSVQRRSARLEPAHTRRPAAHALNRPAFKPAGWIEA